MTPFQPPPPSFAEKKAKITAHLDLPASEYTDLSPKGTVDVALLDVIREVNAAEGFVTTSSCAGRASVFLEGSRVRRGDGGTVAAAGGKGGGGTWLYVSHDPFEESCGERDWEGVFGLKGEGEGLEEGGSGDEERRFIHFKFEPMILHVLTASLEHAQSLLRCAQQAGFRESGIINVTAPAEELDVTPIVAIRTMGLAFESLIGCQLGRRRESMVSAAYLETLVDVANTRFRENKKRIERFREGFRGVVSGGRPEGWEDSEVRKARKRAEGLRRREEMRKEQASKEGADDDDDAGGVLDTLILGPVQE